MVNKGDPEKSIAEATILPKKRGRKSKKDIELALQQQINLNNCSNNILSTNTTNNINVLIEDTCETKNNLNILDDNTNENDENIVEKNIFLSENLFDNSNNIKQVKKRGRKPKGGKIIQQTVQLNNDKEVKPNVILHLKCSLKDLHTNTLTDNDFDSFNFLNKNQLSYNIIKENTPFNTSFNTPFINSEETLKNNNDYDYDNENNDDEDDKQTKDADIREVWRKLKQLEHNLHTNNICDKKSACFWCTCDFDNPPIYIPKHYIKDTYHVYGCFCSPECSTAYLMEENIDISTKFERYHLLNHIYSKIYNYKKNIKPAPDPFYMLDKYYGNLTIQEYRALLRNERLFLVVDKPLTRIFPELHEDNDDFIINNKIIPSNTYQIKKLQKKQNKTNILSERFGINQNQI